MNLRALEQVASFAFGQTQDTGLGLHRILMQKPLQEEQDRQFEQADRGFERHYFMSSFLITDT